MGEFAPRASFVYHHHPAEATPPAPPRRRSARSAAKEGLTETERAWLHGQLGDLPVSDRVVAPRVPKPAPARVSAPAPALAYEAAPVLAREIDVVAEKYRVVLACTCHSQESPERGND